MMILIPLLIILVLSPTNNVYALHVLSEKGHQNQQFSRRGFLASGSAISTSLLIGWNAQSAGANDETLLKQPPTQPIPMAGIGGAPLQPYVIERTESPYWTAPPMTTQLGQSRIAARELSPLGQPLSPFADADVFYPAVFSGEWNVKATLRRKTYPYGFSFVPSRSLVEGSPRYRNENIDEATSYQARYISLDDRSNKIIADRRFNSLSATKSYNQLSPVEAVEWDPKKDPTLLKFTFAAGQVSPDMMPMGPKRAEVYITARKKEDGPDGESSNNTTFAASERTRQVTIGAGAVIASDTETITEYEISSDGNSICAVQRIAVYLTPNPNSREGILWQQVGGKAIAFFDYDLEMQRRV